jgi:hypothetical protein
MKSTRYRTYVLHSSSEQGDIKECHVSRVRSSHWGVLRILTVIVVFVAVY